MTSPADLLVIESRDHLDGTAVLVLRGELDLASAATLDRVLCDTEDRSPRRIVLDLSALEFIDSTGLSVLVKAQRRAYDTDRQLLLAEVPAQVERLLAIAGLASRFTVT